MAVRISAARLTKGSAEVSAAPPVAMEPGEAYTTSECIRQGSLTIFVGRPGFFQTHTFELETQKSHFCLPLLFKVYFRIQLRARLH